MNDLIYVLAGVLASLATSLIAKEKWSKQTKQSVAVVLAIVTGTVASYFKAKGVDPQQLLVGAASSLGVSQAAFVYVLQTTGLDKVLNGIGSKPAPVAPTAPETPAP